MSKNYKKLISVVLVFTLLINSNAVAFANIELPVSEIQKDLQREIKTVIEETVTETTEERKTPQEFLSDLSKTLEEASKEDNNRTVNRNNYNKLNKEEYTTLYKDKVNEEYNNYIKEIETKAQEALTNFDKEAQDAIDNQKQAYNKTLLTPSRSSNTKNTLAQLRQNLQFGSTASNSFAKLSNNLTSQINTLSKMEQNIAEQREEYIEEINTWKEKSFSSLGDEKKKLLNNIDIAY